MPIWLALMMMKTESLLSECRLVLTKAENSKSSKMANATCRAAKKLHYYEYVPRSHTNIWGLTFTPR